MKRLLCGILAFLCLFLAACAGETEIAFQTVLDEANALHRAQAEMTPESSIRDFKPKFPRSEVGFTEGELVSLTANLGLPFNGKKRVALERAKQDVELLFRALRCCYGPYGYFGGDAVFSQAQAAIFDDLSALGSTFEAAKMIPVFRERLAFLKDGHFFMNSAPLATSYGFFSTEELKFERDERGFFAYLDGKKQYLLSVDGNTDTESYMKLSIGPDGDLIYYLGTLGESNLRNLLMNAAFEKTTVTLMLDNAAFARAYDPATAYAEDWEGVVPVVACRDYKQKDAYRSFLNAAKRLYEAPVAILDLRGNGGGDAAAVQTFLNAYDAGGIGKNGYGVGCFYTVTRAGSYISACNPIYPLSPTVSPEDISAGFMMNYRSGYNTVIYPKTDAKFIWCGADGLLFVLMDKYVYSGGEWLLAALRTRENTVFVGSNSAGGLLGGGGEWIRLPASGFNFSFGSSLLLTYDERVFQEGRGFLPDIWVNGDALERVEALIKHYGLTAS